MIIPIVHLFLGLKGPMPLSVPLSLLIAPWLHMCWGFPNLGKKSLYLSYYYSLRPSLAHFLFCPHPSTS